MQIVTPSRASAVPPRSSCADCGPDDAPEHMVAIHPFEGGWHGVTFRATQLSVRPDGMITLDKHLRPEDVEDLVVALRSAAPIAAVLKAQAAQAANAQQHVQADPRRVLSERLATPTLPALAGRPTKPGFTSERLARAREKLGAIND